MIQITACDDQGTQTNVPPEAVAPLVRREGSTDSSNGSSGGGKRQNGRPHGGVLWVDVSDPTEEDWATLADRFGFHPLAIEDARQQDQWAKTALYDGYLSLSARVWMGATPQHPAHDMADVTSEIDVFLGPDYLVTIHDGRSRIVRETKERWAKSPDKLPQARHSPAFLLYLLLDAVVDDFFPAMDLLDQEIDSVEMEIYGTGAISDIKPALRLKKRLLLLRQAVTPLRDVLNQLMRTDEPDLLPPAYRVYFQDVYDHTLRLAEQVDLHRDILSGAMDALMAQTSNRLNQVMKTLTSVSTILMSVSLISGIYGMNFKNMPELNLTYGYYYALGAMAAVAIGLTIFFRKIDWF